MRQDQIRIVVEPPESLQVDGVLRCLPQDRFTEELRGHLEDLPEGSGTVARQILRSQQSLEAGLAIRTIAPSHRAGSITWVLLANSNADTGEENLLSQLRMGLQYLEEGQSRVIVIEEPRALEVYETVEDGINYWTELLKSFPTSRISRVFISKANPAD